MVSRYFILVSLLLPRGLFDKDVCKARAKTSSLPAIADQASKTAFGQATVTLPQQARCATLEQVVTIGTAAWPTAQPQEKPPACLLQPRQQERRAFQRGMAQPLQIVSPASEPIQGMEVARQHVIPSGQAVPSTICRDGTIG
jgi:hypothetical protein